MVLAMLGTYLASFGEGLCMGFPNSSKNLWGKVFPNLSGTWFHLLLPIGGIIGSLTNAVCNKSIGRNKTIMVGAFEALIAMILLLMAKQFESLWALYLGVVFMGAACGIVSHTAPTYLHEVSHYKTRGKIVSGHPAAVAVGLSLSLLIGSNVHLHVLTCLSVLPFVFSSLVLALSPASPLWLAEKNRPKEAIQFALTKLHGPSDFADRQLQLLTSRRAMIFSNSVKTRSVHVPMAISMGLMVLQQLSGVSGVVAILYQYELSGRIIIAFCVTHTAMSIVAVFLHDVVGRKTLLYVSSSIEFLGLIILGATWGSVKLGFLGAERFSAGLITGLSVFIGGFSIGYGPVPWIMMNELSPSKAKTFTTTASTTTSWIFDTIVTETFSLLLKAAGGPVTFFVFSIFVVVSFVFVYLFVPETSGLTIEQLEKRFRDLYEKLFVSPSDSRDVVINEVGNDTESHSSHGSNP
ncbi:sugar transporter ERD6-like 6 [Galendromus occidentalis]|uniref:Sugar transporter ERD6-like 6 n=1 Tax=Galendromus occidentalis TaxID=34638 RepID=A0AAJ6QW83_9ACAR|nr:sugar transporter ERD6-like 6 [Galendromus occidentalis]